MEKQPKISVVIPVYNAEQYLKQCLDSVIKQSLEDIEIICVDDGSKDGSVDILTEYEKLDSRILVLHQENQGAGNARNLGLEQARGEYVHFLDADDYLAENAYKTMYAKAVQWDTDVVKTKGYGVDSKTGKYIENIYYDMTFVNPKYFDRALSFEGLPHILAGNVAVVPWNGIYRKKFLMDKGIRFNSLVCVNDRSFYCHAVMAAEKIVLLKEITVYHRMNMATSLVGKRAEHFECHFASYRIVEKLCEGLSPRLRAIMLGNQIHDIFSWYVMYRDNKALGEKITEQMRKFVKDLDWDFFVKNGARMLWKQQYLMLLAEEGTKGRGHGLSKKAESLNGKIKRTIWCVQDAGIGNTLQRIWHKVMRR